MTGLMSHLRGGAAVVVWLVLLIADARAASLTDNVANWIVGLLASAVAGATGYHVIQKRVQSRVREDDSITREQDIQRQLETITTAAFGPKATDDVGNVDVYKVWYATNRQMQAGEFTSEFSNNLRFGDCQVAIPQSHKFGSVGSSSAVRLIQRLTTGTDDALRIVKRSDWSLEEGQHGFLTSVAAALTGTANQILVYIHGYNVTFEDAILRAAQIGFDLKVP